MRKGYKQTNIGVIPESWGVKALGEIGDPTIGLTYKPENVREFGLLVLRASNIDSNGRLQYNDNVYVDIEVQRNLYTRPGDILVCVRNGSRPLIGKSALIDESSADHTFGAFMSVYRTADFDYVFHLFNSDILRSQIQHNLGATINQITNRDLRSFVIPFPPAKGERIAIATALSDADALIESLEKLIAKKRAIKQGAMQQLLTGKRRLPGFSGEWKEKRLCDLADVDPDQLGSDTRPNYEFKYISLEDVDRGSLRGYSEQVFSSAPSRARRKLRSGDILFSTVRPNLKSHFWFQELSPDWICSTGFAVLRCRERLSKPGYIFAHLFADSITKQVEALLTGSNYPAINGNDVRQLMVPVPAVEEQAAIAQVLSDMDAEIESLEEKLAKCRMVKQGMMQELLTGRKRLI